MRVPCVTIDGITELEMIRVRTELRRKLFSCWIFDKTLFAMTGQIDVVRRIAQRYAYLHPRCRKTVVDGEELMQGRDQTPGQYIDRDDVPNPQPKIAKVHGLERGAWRVLLGELKHAGFDAVYSEENSAILIEYCKERKPELDALIASVMASGQYVQTKGPTIRYEGKLT